MCKHILQLGNLIAFWNYFTKIINLRIILVMWSLLLQATYKQILSRYIYIE